MTTCRQCGQLLAPDNMRRCPACGEVTHALPSTTGAEVSSSDPEAEAHDLLASVVAHDDDAGEATRRLRPPLVPPLSERMRPAANPDPPARRDLGDVLPSSSEVLRRRRWPFRRARG